MDRPASYNPINDTHHLALYECPNTGASVHIDVSTDMVLATIPGAMPSDRFGDTVLIPVGLIHRALEREGYTVVIEKPHGSHSG